MKVLVSAYTDENYLDYWPLWLCCIEKAYPNYETHMKLIKDKKPQHRPACMRFLEPLFDADYYYITDIDMMILPENPPLHEFHLAEMKESGLCYSNSPRNNSEPKSYERMTGLHFANNEWWDKTREARGKYLELLDAGLIGNDRFDDEIVLKNIILESGLALPPKRPLARRHHGIHMGTLRAYRWHNPSRLENQLSLRISPKQAEQWLTIVDGLEYPCLAEKVNKTIEWELNALEAFCRRRVKQNDSMDPTI